MFLVMNIFASAYSKMDVTMRIKRGCACTINFEPLKLCIKICLESIVKASDSVYVKQTC